MIESNLLEVIKMIFITVSTIIRASVRLVFLSLYLILIIINTLAKRLMGVKLKRVPNEDNEDNVVSLKDYKRSE